jgi:mono/diheme cytochrome c family protein
MKNLLFVFMILFVSCNNSEDKNYENVQEISIDGERLFKNHCASCHKPDKDFTGPAIKGSLERWGDKKALYEFIRNPMLAITKNTYAKKMQKKWKSVMTAFNLSDKEIDAILAYCENYKPVTVNKN